MKLYPIILLICSNLFMTYAWYGHLKDMRGRAPKPVSADISFQVNVWNR